MRNHKGTVLIIGAVCALAGCNAAGTGDSSGRSSSVTSVCESRTQTLTDGLWDGEAITAENAREKGIVYCSDGESANTELWNGFLRDVKKAKRLLSFYTPTALLHMSITIQIQIQVK